MHIVQPTILSAPPVGQPTASITHKTCKVIVWAPARPLAQSRKSTSLVFNFSRNSLNIIVNPKIKAPKFYYFNNSSGRIGPKTDGQIEGHNITAALQSINQFQTILHLYSQRSRNSMAVQMSQLSSEHFGVGSDSVVYVVSRVGVG